MLATVGALLAHEKVTPVRVVPVESCAVAEKACAWLGEIEAVFGVTLMLATVELELEEWPPQPSSKTLIVDKQTRLTQARLGTGFDRMMVKSLAGAISGSAIVTYVEPCEAREVAR